MMLFYSNISFKPVQRLPVASTSLNGISKSVLWIKRCEMRDCRRGGQSAIKLQTVTVRDITDKKRTRRQSISPCSNYVEVLPTSHEFRSFSESQFNWYLNAFTVKTTSEYAIVLCQKVTET